jgi:hypothetical protein
MKVFECGLNDCNGPVATHFCRRGGGVGGGAPGLLPRTDAAQIRGNVTLLHDDGQTERRPSSARTR